MFWRPKPKISLDYLVFGLGNPGLNYVRTRHNVGWWVMDELSSRAVSVTTASRHRSQVDYLAIGRFSIAAIKPLTYMNRSGASVSAWTREFPEAGYCVIYDDISMAIGKCRLRQDGSSGGHKGVQSIIDRQGTDRFDRIKIGVGQPPPGQDAADFVLEPPGPKEEEILVASVSLAASAVIKLVAGETEAAIKTLAG